MGDTRMISGLLTIIRGTSNGNSTTLLPLTVISSRSLAPRTLNVTPGGGGTCPRAGRASLNKQPMASASGKATLAARIAVRAGFGECDRFDIRVFLAAAKARSFLVRSVDQPASAVAAATSMLPYTVADCRQFA